MSATPTGFAPHLVTTLTLFMPGKPMTRKEPLIGRRGGKTVSYPHPDTKRGLNTWRQLWAIKSRQMVEGPVILEVYIRVRRPDSHRGRNGDLNARGKAYPVPLGFDVSNVVKLVEDALKTFAFGDDDQIVAIHAAKRWATLLGDEGTEVSVSQSL